MWPRDDLMNRKWKAKLIAAADKLTYTLSIDKKYYFNEYTGSVICCKFTILNGRTRDGMAGASGK